MNFEKSVRLVDYLPHFWGGWVGFVGYEAVALFENITLTHSNKIPDLSFMEVERLFIFDHKNKTLKFILSGHNKTKESDYEDFHWEIKRVLERRKKSFKKNQPFTSTGRKTFFFPPLSNHY